MWAGRLAAGSSNPITRAELREVCANWVEFTTQVTALWGGNTSGENERTEHFLWNVYLGAVGAPPSPSVMQPHINALNLATAQGEEAVIAKAREIARAQITSTAYASRNRTDREYVADLYQVFWQRVPDQSGWEHWTREVSIRGRESVLMRFASSTAFKEVASTLYRETLWLVTDHLGTPRMIAERTGSLSGIKRHDYLPFGEEIFAGTAGRTAAQGYVSDSVRQQFTSKERDDETELDYFLARYYSSAQGRFISVDPITITLNRAIDPQQINLYAYTRNNPLKYIDPTGMEIDTTRLTEQEQEQFRQVEALANAQDENGNYLHPELHEQYTRLKEDKEHTFIILGAKLDGGTLGVTNITEFNGSGDFKTATIELDFKKIADVSNASKADKVEGFKMFEGLLGDKNAIRRLAEIFGHEARHATFALNNPADAVFAQKANNYVKEYLNLPAFKGKYPVPADVVAKDVVFCKFYNRTETAAQQTQKIINAELRATVPK